LFHFGPFDLTPSISVTNVGRDENVFNDTANAKGDTTATFVPALNFWGRVGRSRLRGRTAGQYLYFTRYANQRGWSSQNEGRWEVPLGRLMPFVTGRYLNTFDRPSYEIDARTRSTSQGYGVGTEVHFSGKTYASVTARRQRDEYDPNQTF